MGLTVILPTLNRPTLSRTIDSFASQLADDDEVIVVSRDPAAREQVPKDPRWRFVGMEAGFFYGGWTERNHAIPMANGSHLCFIDDDDIFTADALSLMRDAACDRPVIFRMDARRLGIGVLWAKPELTYTNVSTQMLLVPNQQLPLWEPYRNGRGADFTFITRTCDTLGEPVWREEITAVCRPA